MNKKFKSSIKFQQKNTQSSPLTNSTNVIANQEKKVEINTVANNKQSDHDIAKIKDDFLNKHVKNHKDQIFSDGPWREMFYSRDIGNVISTSKKSKVRIKLDYCIDRIQVQNLRHAPVLVVLIAELASSRGKVA